MAFTNAPVAVVLRRAPGLRALVAIAAIALLAGPPLPAAAEAPPTPLFIQLRSLTWNSPAAVQSWMERTCAGRELVLQDIAGPDGRLYTTYLDVLVPYFPGGSKACLRRAFVGTVDLDWTGAGSKYDQGVQDPAFRQRYLTLSQTAAQAFSSRYPSVQFDWYLTYEANLNLLYYPGVHQAYRSMLATEMRNLRAVRAGAVMWSPAYAYPYWSYRSNTAGMLQLRANLINLFSTLNLTAGGLQYLNLQDYVGGSSCEPAWNRTTPADAAGWASWSIGLKQVSTVQLNVEHFMFNCATGAIGPGNATELANRIAYYQSRQIPIGPSFEIRYWMQVNGMSLAA